MKIIIMIIIILNAIMISSINSSTFLMKMENNPKNIDVLKTPEYVKEVIPIILSCNIGELDVDSKKCKTELISDIIFTCPSGLSNYNSSSCYGYLYKGYTSANCPSGYISVNGSCYASVNKVSGTTCSSGYTYGKWAAGYCVDSAAYTTVQGANCGNGTTSIWDSKNYVCRFATPYSYIPEKVCPSSTVNGNCINLSDSKAYTYTCSSGYSWDGNRCSAFYLEDKIRSCLSGFVMNNDFCTKTVIEDPVNNPPPSE